MKKIFLIISFAFLLPFIFPKETYAQYVNCGATAGEVEYPNVDDFAELCLCGSGVNNIVINGVDGYCCGVVNGSTCQSPPSNNPPQASGNPTNPPQANSPQANSPQANTSQNGISESILDGPSNDFFDSMNPLKTDGDATIADQLSTPGGIVSRLLQFLFPLAGLVLFVMLIWGGFEILSKSTQGTKALEAGKNRITAAIVGFILLFATYWMAQIIEAVFGIVIV